VLVLHDLIGVFPGHKARFAKNFMEGASSIDAAVTRYVDDVRSARFPAPEHCY
jgi:3-methyl-2-oxobutanoate hydroxymethyltransferase